MRVLFASSDNNKASGAFLSLVQLCIDLRKLYNVEVLVVIPERGDGEELLFHENIRVEYVKSFHWIDKTERLRRKPWRYLKWILKFIYNTFSTIKTSQIVREFSPDIIHINTSYSYVPANAAIRNKIPFIWHIREYLEEGQQLQIVFKQYGYKLMSKASSIICVSEGLLDKYKELILGTRLICIYNGIEKNRFEIIDRRIFQDDIYRFVCVGGLYPEKGQETLIRACKKLCENGVDNFVLDIVGRGENEMNLREVIRANGLDKKVIMRGYSSCPEKYYANSDIAFVTSKEESFGRVVIEAMMSGCLVVTSDYKAAKEITENGKFGVLFKYDDVESLYSVIIEILNNTRQMGAFARIAQKNAIENYSSIVSARNIYEEYKRVLGSDN